MLRVDKTQKMWYCENVGQMYHIPSFHPGTVPEGDCTPGHVSPPLPGVSYRGYNGSRLRKVRASPVLDSESELHPLRVQPVNVFQRTLWA